MAKTLLVTGGGRGLGRACALLAAAEGWAVAVNYRADQAAAEAAVAAVRRAGGQAAAIRADVSRDDEAARLFDAAEAELGPLTGFVNNAGVVAESSPLVEMNPARIRRILDVNLYGALLCAREAARRMVRRPNAGASIVNVSSVAARTGAPGEYVDYAAAKAGLDALTVGLAKELGPFGVRVNAVRPGFIDTEIHASGGRPDRARTLGAQTPLGRPGRAEEAAEAVVWLLSDRASYVTGAVLDVAGGR